MAHISNQNSPVQRERISQAVEAARDAHEGVILTGGCAPGNAPYDRGLFYRPTLVADVVPESMLMNEEIFGPVLPVMPVPDLDAAIHEANRTRYGLGASVWTNNLHTAKRVFDEVNAGIVWVNRHLTVPPEIPFGGMNESGIGRENGIHALDSYTRTRTLFLNW